MRLFVFVLAGALLAGCDTAPDIDAGLTSPSVWILASGAEAEGAEVTFGTDGRFSAQLVCNAAFGAYSASSGRIEISVEGTTYAGCGDGNAAEVATVAALEAADQFQIEGDRLTLRGPDVRLVFQLRVYRAL